MKLTSNRYLFMVHFFSSYKTSKELLLVKQEKNIVVKLSNEVAGTYSRITWKNITSSNIFQ